LARAQSLFGEPARASRVLLITDGFAAEAAAMSAVAALDVDGVALAGVGLRTGAGQLARLLPATTLVARDVGELDAATRGAASRFDCVLRR
jgi:hypothetical protein